MNKSIKIFEKDVCISEEQMWAYINDKLNPKEIYLVEKHISQCEMCSDQIDGMRLLGKNSLDLYSNQLDSYIDKTIITAPKGKSILFKRIISIAAILLLLVGITLYYNSISSKNPSVPIAQNDIKTDKTEPLKESEETIANEPTVDFENISEKKEKTLTKPLISEKIISQHDEAEQSFSYYESEEISVDDKVEEISTVAPESKIAASVSEKESNDIFLVESITTEDRAKEKNIDNKTNKARSSKKLMDNKTNAPSAEYSEPSYQSREAVTAIEKMRENFSNKLYQNVVQNQNSIGIKESYYHEAQWLTAQSYYKLAKRKECETILKELAKSNSIYKDSALHFFNTVNHNE
ncbi:MAG: hypothetical protein IPO21_00585 [Bacteroidales bacterium]|nr:hypothetical protein [Bacteroidales bacterium]